MSEKIQMNSQGVWEDGPKKGKKSGHFLIRTKNKKGEKANVKLEFMKFDPYLGRQVLYKEGKLKK